MYNIDVHVERRVSRFITNFQVGEIAISESIKKKGGSSVRFVLDFFCGRTGRPVSSTSWSDLELKTTTISLVRWHQVSTSSPKSGCGKSPDLDVVRRVEVIERGS